MSLDRLTIQWPLLLLSWKAPHISLDLFDSSDGAIGEPALCGALVGGLRTTRVSLRLPADKVAPLTFFRARISRQSNARLVAELQFDALSVTSIAGKIQITDLSLFALCKSERICCDEIHDQVEQAEFCLTLQLENEQHASFLNQMETEVRAELLTPSGSAIPVTFWKQRLRFEKHTFKWKQKAGPTACAALGDYTVRFLIDQILVGTKTFHVTSHQAYLTNARNHVKQHMLLRELAVSAVNHKGVAGPLEIVAEDFRRLDISFVLNAPRPAALLSEIDFMLRVAIRRFSDDKAVGSQERTVTLCGGEQRLEESIELRPDMFTSGPGRYRIDVLLDESFLNQIDFFHKTRSQLKREKAELIFQSLRLKELCLFVMRDGQRIETDHFFENDRSVMPRFAIEGGGFDDDAPMLKWRMGIKVINLRSAAVFEEQRFLHTKAGENVYPDFEIPLQGPNFPLRPGHYALQLLKRDMILAEREFHILALEEIPLYTEKLVLQSIHAENSRLSVQCGSARYESAEVPVTSDFILPEMTIHSSGYNSFLPQLQTRLKFALRREGGERRELTVLPVTLTPEPAHIGNIAIKVRDASLGAAAGRCQLTVCLGEKDLTTWSFRIVPHDEIMERVIISSITLEAFNKSGKPVRNPPSLQLREHESVAIAVEIKVGILAPNVVMEGTVVLQINQAEVGHADFDLQLDRAVQVIRTGRIPLQSLVSAEDVAESSLAIAVLLHGQQKHRRVLRLIRGQQISNFEGQLTVDPHNLKVNENELQEILNRLNS